MTYKFWELLAAKTTGADIKKMFTRTNKREEVLARMLCMVFVEDAHEMCQDDNAKRFGLKGHSSVSHSKKTLSDRSEYDKPFKLMVNKYFKLCFDHLAEEKCACNKLLSTASDFGISGIVHEQNAVFIRLMYVCEEFILGHSTDTDVLAVIEQTENAIEKLKFNFTK